MADSGPDPQLVTLLSDLAPDDGIHQTPWPALSVFRASAPSPVVRAVYQPCLCLAVQGRKRVVVGDEALTYDPLRYLVVSVPLPVEGQIIEASAEHPYLALILNLDASMVGELVRELDATVEPQPSGERRGLHTSAATPALLDATRRFLVALSPPVERKLIAPGVLRELVFHLLMGEQAGLLRALPQSNSDRVAQVVRFLDQNFDRALDVPSLAKQAGMCCRPPGSAHF